MTAEPHPQRCETCRKEDCDNHPKQVGFYEQYGNIIADIIKDDQKLFSEYGCASHSSAKSEQEILDKYNDELLTKLVQELAGTWRMRDGKLFAIIRKYRRVPIGAMKQEEQR